MNKVAAPAMHVHDDVLSDLRQAVPGAVQTGDDEIFRVLRDNSWLSPVLLEALERRRETEGPTLGVVAVVAPATEEEVISFARVAVHHRLAVTPRGSGTSNFGLVTPEHGGVVLDLRRLKGACVLDDGGVRAPAGVLQGDMESAAREQGRQLCLLTTTYAQATVGGWVAGGHVGLGSSVFGSVWDHTVVAARVVAFDDEPRVKVLTGNAVLPVLHTFGTMGVLTEVTVRTAPLRDWLEAVAFFPTFDVASACVQTLSSDRSFHHRVVTAQEEELMPAFKPLRAIASPGSGVLMIIDTAQQDQVRELVEGFGGRLVVWQPWSLRGGARPSIAGMVYGHRMLWVKRLLPTAAFLHVYFDPADPARGVAAVKERFGDEVLLEMKYVRSPWMLGVLGFDPEASLPAAVITIRDGEAPEAIATVMQFCREAGIPFQNPHTNVIEENGMFPDLTPLVAFKAEVDPYNLLNPGKLRSAQRRQP